MALTSNMVPAYVSPPLSTDRHVRDSRGEMSLRAGESGLSRHALGQLGVTITCSTWSLKCKRKHEAGVIRRPGFRLKPAASRHETCPSPLYQRSTGCWDGSNMMMPCAAYLGRKSRTGRCPRWSWGTRYKEAMQCCSRTACMFASACANHLVFCECPKLVPLPEHEFALHDDAITMP